MSDILPTPTPQLILRGYWRSSATWRVRIALHYKSIPFQYIPIHLVRDGGEQHSAQELPRNPLAQVPTLELDSGVILTQSLAIIDYLESVHPNPSLYPTNPLERARAIQIAEVINAGIQPLQNLSLLLKVGALGFDKAGWGREYIERGLLAIESMISDYPKHPFLIGEAPSIADLCLIPQLYNARRFKVNLDLIPRLCEIETLCQELTPFKRAHPDSQVDAQL